MQNLEDISIQYIKGVGPARKRLFQNLGVETLEDLLYFFPRRYEDRSAMTPIKELKVGEYHTVTGKVASRDSRRSWYTKSHVYETVIEDGAARMFAVWFNQPYLDSYFKVGKHVVLYGKVDMYKDRLQMVSPEYEILGGEEDQALNTGRIVPVYPLTRGMTQRYLRKVVRNALDRYRDGVPDILPVGVRNKYRLLNIKRSLENIHFPESLQMQENAHHRVSFEEFFLFQISVIKRRRAIITREGVAHQIDEDLISQFANSFPFALTGAQRKVISEIAGDMKTSAPMLRLLSGDVGSGKTLVALFGCVAAFVNKRQAAVMVPTEILARQHFNVMQETLRNSPFSQMRVALLISSLKKKEKDQVHDKLKNGEVDLVIGTHALLSETVEFPDLSFVVIDEQHKFGVRQRALLSAKAGGACPDILVMTATPIPRTLSLTLFADLDVSVIDEMPQGRGKVKTHLYTHDQSEEVYNKVRERVRKGQQVYIIYPIIEESEKLDLKAAQTSFRHFQRHEFKDFNVGLVHGQMKKGEAGEVMQRFKNKEIDILVATTVLEVGVDVPNAGVMVIEHAERFGLAQLHQLRGRVGRGEESGLCLLVADAVTEEGKARLKAILSSTDGFKIAEQDLMIRGPGHYFGRHQHGLNELRFADPLTQVDILEKARKEAIALTAQDPELDKGENKRLKTVIQKRYPNYMAMVEAG